MSEENESEDFCLINCANCDIAFKITVKAEESWRKSHKSFHCPNGHDLSWKEEVETKDQKEIKTLRARIQELEKLLKEAKTSLLSKTGEADSLTKVVAELRNEIEIWRPNRAS